LRHKVAYVTRLVINASGNIAVVYALRNPWRDLPTLSKLFNTIAKASPLFTINVNKKSSCGKSLARTSFATAFRVKSKIQKEGCEAHVKSKLIGTKT